MEIHSCLNCKNCVWSGEWKEIEFSGKNYRRMFGRCDYLPVPAVFSLNHKIYHDEGYEIAGAVDCPCWESTDAVKEKIKQ